MFSPVYYDTSAIVKRNVYIDEKSSLQATWNIYKWYLAPLTEEDGLELDKFWKQFNFTTKETADIVESDILEINWEDYNVKWSAPWKWKIIKYKKILLVKK